jgi:hypothetical protein
MIAPTLLASTAIILLSFVSEDAATISSALSIFGGPLSWPVGFVSCFASTLSLVGQEEIVCAVAGSHALLTPPPSGAANKRSRETAPGL